MAKGPKVSIIVPVYNTGKLLGRCLDSIARQSFADWECIVINDGSTDDSAAVMEAHAEADSRFRVVTQPNGGVSSARNRGLDIARGEWVTFVDSDDYIEDDALEAVLRHLDAHDADMVMTGYEEDRFFLVDGVRQSDRRMSTMPQWVERHKTEEQAYLLNRHDAATLLFETSASYWGYICKWFLRKNIESWNLRFESGWRYNEDRLFSFIYLSHMRASCKTLIVNAPIYHYVIRPGSAMFGRFNGNLLMEFATFNAIIELERKMFCDAELNGAIRYAGLKRKFYLTWAAMNINEYEGDVAEKLESAERSFLTFRDCLPPYHRYTRPLVRRWMQNTKYRICRIFNRRNG